MTPSETLLAFLSRNAGARRVAVALRRGAEVAIRFVDEPGDWRLHVPESGRAHFETGKAGDPDFELIVPTAALDALVSQPDDADVGDLGIAFFEHVAAKDPARRIGLQVHSGLLKLTRRGWFGVLSLGGRKVAMWMAGKGLRGGGSIASALGRFR